MHPQMNKFRVAIYRGGTSKGIFINRNQLPKDPLKRDRIINAIFGSPDLRQIDGLGGADVLTSKLAIIGPSTRPDADIDYTFAQVSFETEFVDYSGNCGNISSAVGPYAIDEGFVDPVEPITKVKIHLTNTGNIIVAEVPVVDGKASVEGDCKIDGVPGTGSKIMLDFSDLAGAFTGNLLPTGNAKDVLDLPGYGKFTVSIVDAANPLVFIRAEELGLTGTETADEIETDKALMEKIERIRGAVAEKIGMVESWDQAAKKTPYIPFFSIISPPQTYDTFNNKHIKAEDVDITARLLFMLRVHKTYPGTGTVCTGAAARIHGTVVWDVLREEAKHTRKIRIGHPAGIIEVESQMESADGHFKLTRAAFYRTARRIMEGYVYVKKSILD